MKLKQANIEEGDKLIYVEQEPNLHNGNFYVDFVTRPANIQIRPWEHHICREAIYTTREEALHKIEVLNKIMLNQKGEVMR